MNLKAKTTNTSKLFENQLPNAHWIAEYCEPGYDAPKNGIILDNWNAHSERLIDFLESRNYSIEWADEWDQCQSCNKAVRTSPNSYDYTPYYHIFDCSIICINCIKDYYFEEYLEECINNPETFFKLPQSELTDRGFIKITQNIYETWWHHGQTDKPQKILAKQLGQCPNSQNIFGEFENSQFYSKYSLFSRTPPKD